tara:strand:- start:2669 stop:2908 length:240 start_codon:yes stop_codon:yes gene_type:complete
MDYAAVISEGLKDVKPAVWLRDINVSDGDLAFFTTWCRAGTDIQTLVTVEGHRWAIEDSFETANNVTPPKRPKMSITHI